MMKPLVLLVSITRTQRSEPVGLMIRNPSEILMLVCCVCPQVHSNREMEEAMTKIRDVLSDDKRDWELRVAAVS